MAEDTRIEVKEKKLTQRATAVAAAKNQTKAVEEARPVGIATAEADSKTA